MNTNTSVVASTVPDKPFELLTPGGLQPAVTLGLNLPQHVSGLPAFYYWKDAIVVGSYVHPAGKFSLEITADKLDGYAENFRRMASNGVGVPILMDHTASAAATLGWIVDVKRRGNRLLELHQFLGEEAKNIGLRNKVSLGIDPDFVDGKGNRYGEAIVHSAITPTPVVPGQGEFVALSLELAPGEYTRGLHEDERGEGESSEIESNATHNTQRSTLNVEVEEGAGQVGVESSRYAGGDPACIHAGLIMEAVAVRRDLAVARGGVTPAVAAELYELLVQSPAGAINTLTLSRQGNSRPLALAVFEALARNRALPMGETTGVQVLSRQVPGEEAVGIRQRMIEMANGGRA